MSSASDFIIENGVLKKYVGPGGDVVIPHGVTSIGNEAFQDCSGLTSVTIPEGVTNIGREAFCNCRKLSSVTIPDSLTSIGDRAFYGCSSLTSVTIPEGVTSIGYSAFQGCSSLTSVTIPDSVTSIWTDAFSGCSSLASVEIPDSVTSIGNSAFYYCSSLTSVTIPDSVTRIGNQAFKGCSKLADAAGFVIVKDVLYDYNGPGGDVTIPEGVTSIGDSAFNWCSSLTSVTIPGSVTSIGGSAFQHCSSLTGVVIPEGVTSIGYWAFDGCSSLTSVTIPDSVTSIDKNVFSGCKNLTSIFTNTRLSKDMFGKSLTKPIITNDPGMLPAHMKPLAAIGFAEQPDDPKSEREKKHLKYIKSNAAKLVKEALSHPALLGLMCEEKLLTPEVTEAYLAAAQEAGNTEAITALLDYQQNKLTKQEKEKAAQKAETREEKVTDFIFSAEALEQLQGKVFVVTGALKSFTREQFKACLDACGAVLSETLNEQTDYLITNTPNSGSAKNKKADALGVKKLSEAEFNRLIGRTSF